MSGGIKHRQKIREKVGRVGRESRMWWSERERE